MRLCMRCEYLNRNANFGTNVLQGRRIITHKCTYVYYLVGGRNLKTFNFNHRTAIFRCIFAFETNMYFDKRYLNINILAIKIEHKVNYK